ncbi:hypothetical protein HQ545_03060 [Candidatus Woesearchaeota archaeon]|nr:hypothetical protein [Candidatus Woesearchaeota archaeon]
MEINNYEKLEIFIDRWISGTIDLLIIESEPGLGKTELVKRKLKEVSHLAINNHITPLANYKQLYHNRDKVVWFDDVYYVLLNKLNIATLKQLCETTQNKKLCYHTKAELLGDVPAEFTKISKVLITCNAVEGKNPHLRAVKDRGFHIKFVPTRQEVIAKLQEVTNNYPLLEQKEKEEVLNIIEYNSQNIKSLSLRTLIKGFQLYSFYKLKNVDWKEDFLKELDLNEKLARMNSLLVKYDSDIDRLKEWDWSRQSFYNYKKMLEV